MDLIEIETPAKINTVLKVTGRRPDGYHELVSVMIPVDVTDTLTIRRGEGRGLQLRCTGRRVPDGEDNLAHRAARAFLSEAGTGDALDIHLHKRIPTAAGLGGGSSDAAAVLRGLDALYPGRVSREQLERLAVGIGADVPFFLHAVPSLAKGIGEILKPLEYWPDLWYVLVKPRIEVSTAWVYGQFSFELTADRNIRNINSLNKNAEAVAATLENDLESVTLDRFPEVRVARTALVEAGAMGALMSGSGPTVFGIFDSPGAAAAAGERLLPRGVGEVFTAANWKRAQGGIDQ